MTETDKDRIIMAVAFAKACPTLESYLKACRRKNGIHVKYGDFKTMADAEAANTDYYTHQAAIAEVALKNGYKGFYFH